MLSVVIIVVAFVLVSMVVAAGQGSQSRFATDRIDRAFVLSSPLPLVITLIVPIVFSLATSFQSNRFVSSISVVGCYLSVLFLLFGLFLYARAKLRGSKDSMILIPATILASIPALILIFVFLFGFGGVMRH